MADRFVFCPAVAGGCRPCRPAGSDTGPCPGKKGVFYLREQSNERFVRMTTQPVGRLILRLAAPTIISMLVSAVYNMADTYFVSQLGTSAAGAVGVVFPLMAMIQAIGFTLGMGSGNNISRRLGARDSEGASRYGSSAFFGALAFGVVLAVFGLLFKRPLVDLLGATETIAPYAEDYASYILIGSPYMAASYVLNNILRAQGCAFYAMFGLTAGGILNIALDPLFISVFGMGTGGAALATIVSQLISFIILLFMVQRYGEVRMRISFVERKWPAWRDILYTGMPSFWRQGLASIASVLLNVCAARATADLVQADAAIAAMSIVSRITWFAMAALIGFGQGFQPVCGFNYGARRYDRVRQAFWFCVKVATIALAVIAVGLCVAAEPLLRLFRADDAQVIEIGVVALRLQAVALPLQAWVTMCNMAFQTIGDGLRASVLALARQGLCFIPLILILTACFGILGVQLAQPAADVATFLIAVPLGLHLVRDMNRRYENELRSSK